MKIHGIYLMRNDGVHLICSVCDKDQHAVKYCEENNKDFSHGICPDCVIKPVPEGEVFPVEVIPFKSAGFIERHNIRTEEDMKKFLNGEL